MGTSPRAVTSHTPASQPGCTIFVKLWQFGRADRTHVRVATDKMRFVLIGDGVAVMPLFSDGREDVVLERWSRRALVSLAGAQGVEILVLDGAFSEGGDRFRPESWLRLRDGRDAIATSGTDGETVCIKRDHLSEPPSAPSI